MSKVAAVVVTFNRKALLIRCLELLQQQTRTVDKIIVIDNASSDGTPDLLQDKGYLDNSQIDYVRLPANTGGAGGFHEGMKRAHTAGYDWLWLMDDDGYPAPNCLEKLLTVSDRFEVIGSTVLSTEDASKLALKLRILDAHGNFAIRQYIQTYEQLLAAAPGGIYSGFANFFNGVLINKEIVEQIGYVQKELFIWGDEYEYFIRIKQTNYKIATKSDAFYYHPESLFKFTEIKHYHYFRNLFYIYRQYADSMYSGKAKYLYPFYTLITCLRSLPSYSPQYLKKILTAIFWATQGQLQSF
ncbi:glycosyltransferase family 2 protein [Sphaerothrix gracilis]|uniref:glycosyltransferase family 2 protein n=1 Tax=Sphaerothrix gracilis TaxID=3151835 RepID=UPI0031FCC306